MDHGGTEKKIKSSSTGSDHPLLSAICVDGMGHLEGFVEVSTGKMRCISCVYVIVCLHLHWQ